MKLQTLCHCVSDHEGKDLRIHQTAAQLKPFGFGDSSRQKLQNSFCETLPLSLQTQRGKCSFIDRLHPHTCTVKVFLLWMGYK